MDIAVELLFRGGAEVEFLFKGGAEVEFLFKGGAEVEFLFKGGAEVEFLFKGGAEVEFLFKGGAEVEFIVELELIVELSCVTTGKCKPINLNSPKLGMGFGALNAPAMLFVISKMLTCGSVVSLPVENAVPSSVPASHGGNMVTFILSRHLPLSHKSTLSIPMNQSGEGANIVIIDTLEKFAVTSTLIPVLIASGPSAGPPGSISFQAFFAVICALISFTRVPVAPKNKIFPMLYLCNCNCAINKFRSYF